MTRSDHLLTMVDEVKLGSLGVNPTPRMSSHEGSSNALGIKVVDHEDSDRFKALVWTQDGYSYGMSAVVSTQSVKGKSKDVFYLELIVDDEHPIKIAIERNSLSGHGQAYFKEYTFWQITEQKFKHFTTYIKRRGLTHELLGVMGIDKWRGPSSSIIYTFCKRKK